LKEAAGAAAGYGAGIRIPERGSMWIERPATRSGGAAQSADGACATERRCAVRDRRVDADLSRDVDRHVVEHAGSDQRRRS